MNETRIFTVIRYFLFTAHPKAEIRTAAPEWDGGEEGALSLPPHHHHHQQQQQQQQKSNPVNFHKISYKCISS